MTLKSESNFKEKLRNLVNFNASSGKSENSHFDGLHLPIAYKFQLKRYRGMISHDTEE